MSLLKDFTVFHVGGKGGIGKTKYIFKWGKGKIDNLELCVFEADLSDGKDLKDNKAYVKQMYDNYGVRVNILKYCVSDHNGKEDFYIYNDTWASSLFLISDKARNYSSYDLIPPRWEDHCLVQETREVDVTTFEEINKNHLKKHPDFLSMDAQGSEFAILSGATSFLEGDLLGVMTEVEFQEVYEGQPLFADQAQLLKKHGFIFIDLIKTMKFYPGPRIGETFLTVGEGLFLRDFSYFVEKYEDDLDVLFLSLTKLAFTATSFGYESYSYVIIDYIKNRWAKEWDVYSLGDNGKLVNDILCIGKNSKKRKDHKKAYRKYERGE